MSTEQTFTPEKNSAVFRSRDEMQNLYFAVFDAVVRARGMGTLDAAKDLDAFLGDQKDEVLALVKDLMQQWGTLAENSLIDEASQRAADGFSCESGFGHATQRPFITIHANGQFRPEQAREVAFSIIDAAAVAEQDGMVLRWVRDKLGVSEEHAPEQMMQDMRIYREEFREADLKAEGDQLPHVVDIRSTSPLAISQRREQ